MTAIGSLLMVLGAFGLLLPFVGPLFGFGMGPEPAWTVTTSRVVRHVIPGLAVIVGGGMLLPARRAAWIWGATLAMLGGAWFVLARPVMNRVTEGAPLVDVLRPVVYHSGTGTVLVALAAFALGWAVAAVRARPDRTEAPPRVAVTRQERVPAGSRT